MSWQATEWVRVTRVGDSKLKLLLLMLCNYANEDAESWYSQEQISFDTEIPVRTLRRKLEELQGMGFIEVIQRTSESGKKRNSLIRILMGPAANLADGERQRPKQAVASGQNEEDPPANKVAAVNLNHSNHKKHSARAKNETYSEDFEAVWKLAADLGAPRTKNTSKKKTWDHWRMLNEENQARVRAAIPVFAAAMKREGRPDDKIKHFQFFMSERVWETVASATSGPSGAPARPWHETATRDQWSKLLTIYSGTNDWRKPWGPPLGQPGCGVPEDMQAAFFVEHRAHQLSPEDLEKYRAIAAGSKHTVDKVRAA